MTNERDPLTNIEKPIQKVLDRLPDKVANRIERMREHFGSLNDPETKPTAKNLKDYDESYEHAWWYARALEEMGALEGIEHQELVNYIAG